MSVETTYSLELLTYQRSNGQKFGVDNIAYYPKLDPRSTDYCLDKNLLIIGYSLQANGPDPDGSSDYDRGATDWNSQRGTLLIDISVLQNIRYELWDYRVDTTTFDAYVFDKLPNLSLTFV